MIIYSDPDTRLLGSAELIDPVVTCRSSHWRIRKLRSCVRLSFKGCTYIWYFLINYTIQSCLQPFEKQNCSNPIKDWGSAQHANQSQTYLNPDNNIKVVFSEGYQKVTSFKWQDLFVLLLCLHNVILFKIIWVVTLSEFPQKIIMV